MLAGSATKSNPCDSDPQGPEVASQLRYGQTPWLDCLSLV